MITLRLVLFSCLLFLFISCKSSSGVESGGKIQIAFSSDTLNFGSITSGSSKSLNLTIMNSGSTTIKIQTINPESNNSPYSVTGLPLGLSPSMSGQVSVSLTSAPAGAYLERFDVIVGDSTFHFFAKDTGTGSGSDPVIYSFVVMGCNRVDKGDINVSTNPSSANLVQLKRTLTDIAAITPTPNFFFAAGDIVVGESDSLTLANQLIAWKAVWEASPAKAAGIELVAVTGNHETMDANKNAVAFGEQAWLNIMTPYTTGGGNGPIPHSGDPDNLKTDQSKLTYSFDYKDAHFIVISSDPAGLVSQPPANWIAADITAAHNNSATKHIFLVAHKPAYSFDGSSGNGINFATRDIFWTALENAKGEGMISAHNHIYKASRPNSKSWMIIAGNGGSSLETAAPTYFGYVLIEVHQSGTVIEKEYARNFGSSYISPSDPNQFPTTLRDSNVISWK